MIFGDAALGVEGGGDGNVEHLSQTHHLRLGAGRRHAAAGDDHRSFCLRQDARRLPHPFRFRFRPESWALGEGILDDYVRVQNAVGDDVAGNAGKVQVRRQGLARGYLAESLAQQVGQLFRSLHLDAVLGDRGEGAGMLDFLVGIAVPVHGRAVAGDGDDRGDSQVSVLQTGGQVSGADGLGEAEARLARDAGVGVGHVCRRFLAVADDALDAHVLHLNQCAADNSGDEENVGHAVFAKGFGEEPGAGHGGHRRASFGIGLKNRPARRAADDRCGTGDVVAAN